jgi:hypothetical protein
VQALWDEFGSDTILVIADGARTLAMLWASAWADGNGDARVASANLIALSRSSLRTLYEDEDFAPSVILDEIGALLTDLPP